MSIRTNCLVASDVSETPATPAGAAAIFAQNSIERSVVPWKYPPASVADSTNLFDPGTWTAVAGEPVISAAWPLTPPLFTSNHPLPVASAYGDTPTASPSFKYQSGCCDRIHVSYALP